MSDDELRELLAAHALHASLPMEIPEIERFLAENPAAAAEFAHLSTAAAWIGATEALMPPPRLRASVLAAARARQRRPGATDDELTALFRTETDRLEALVAVLGPDDLAAMTANGLSVRDLIIHLAAMESMVSAALGRPVTTLEAVSDVEGRTAQFVEAFALRPIDDVRMLWRDAIAGIIEWAGSGATHGLIPWLGIEVERDTVLIIRAFETWIHANDIRRAIGRPLEHPRPAHLHRMADFSMRNLPTWLEVSGHPHPGRSARVVLTGPGGGSWLVPLSPGEPTNVEAVDVVLEADIVDWCHRVGERVTTDAIAVRIDGDESLAIDILEAASALAML
ncbi:MAG: maleylpyruvate isomerase family mycothiol-dependent enzyme [Acidimicrobiia bacterium]